MTHVPTPSPQQPGGGLFTLHRISLPICAAVALYGLIFPDSLTAVADALIGSVFSALDWFFMATVSFFLLGALWLALGRYAHVRLGAPEDRPDFSTPSWLAMLFAAGMGVGLLFWGVAEPMTHYSNPPLGDSGTAAAARQAMVITNFHWGLHAWGIYCIAALVLGYFGFRKGAPYLAGSPVRAAFRGRWVEPMAGLADLIAVMAVTFGVAGSIGMGVMQLRTGLHVVTGVPEESTLLTVGILIALFISYMISASTGLDKGIKILSNINMSTAVLLMAFVALAGPTGFLLRSFVTALSDYLSGLVGLSLRLYPYQNLEGWMRTWTLTYFVWWIAWAPFVGIFIARISRGRTLRQFVFGVVLAPALFSVLWFAIFGGTGLYEELHGAGGIGLMVQDNVTVALFSLLDRFPLAGVLHAITMVLIFIFLVTSVDSATFVLGMLTSQGSLDPPRMRKLGWGTALGLLGSALTFMGDVDVLRSVTVSGAVPYTLILMLQFVGLVKTLGRDFPRTVRRPR